MDFTVGEKVALKVPMAFLKTSEPMPMLRPPDLVALEEVGDVLGIRPNEYIEVKFRRGTFLIPASNLGKTN